MSVTMNCLLAMLLATAAMAATSGIRLRRLKHKNRCYRKPRFNAVLGEGGQATVYQSSPSTMPNLKVAVKEARQLAEHEIEFLQEFCQPGLYRGVPRLFDLFQSDGRQCMVEQYFKGHELGTIVDDVLIYGKDAAKWENRVMLLLYKITTILSGVHAAGFVHLDIKPDNILYDGDNNVMLIDFGTCIKIGSDDLRSVDSDRMPQNRPVIITASFGAPELTNSRKIGYPNDIYSLGQVAAHLLSHSYTMCPRLVQFMELAMTMEASNRPTADEILHHDVFAPERQRYGVTDADSLPSFKDVIALNGRNAKYFHEFPLPQDDSIRPRPAGAALRRCFSACT